MVFEDRLDAGRQLSQKLLALKHEHPLVLALPRGGVPVGFELAKKLSADLEIFIVRKLGAPGNKEFAIGALAPGAVYLDKDTIRELHVNSEYIDKIIYEEAKELIRREELYRRGKLSVDVTGKTVILVDDGLATGATAKTAILAIKKQHPAKIIFASPVCAKESIRMLEKVATEVICLECPEDFLSVGYWYRNFPQISDAQVLELLRKENVHQTQQYTSYPR